MKLLQPVVIASLMFTAPVLADEKLREVIDDPDRPAEEAERDQYRNPYQTLTFFGIEPDMTVVEVSPGGGWYTGILGPYLREEGRLIAAHWNMEGDIPDFYQRIRAGFDERIADTDRYGDIEVIAFDPPELDSFGVSGEADMVLTFRNVHSYKRDGTFRHVARAAHEALKPGGVFGVVSHRLPEDREQDPEARSGYVQQSWVVGTVESEGFYLAESSEINANPADTADHPDGVWSLPPSLRGGEEDAEKYLEIGESDRFTLKFVKR